MFLDTDDAIPPPRWEPEPARRGMSRRDEGRLMALISLCLVLIFLAPLGGATLWDAVAAAFR